MLCIPLHSKLNAFTRNTWYQTQCSHCPVKVLLNPSNVGYLQRVICVPICVTRMCVCAPYRLTPKPSRRSHTVSFHIAQYYRVWCVFSVRGSCLCFCFGDETNTSRILIEHYSGKSSVGVMCTNERPFSHVAGPNGNRTTPTPQVAICVRVHGFAGCVHDAFVIVFLWWCQFHMTSADRGKSTGVRTLLMCDAIPNVCGRISIRTELLFSGFVVWNNTKNTPCYDFDNHPNWLSRNMVMHWSIQSTLAP